MRQALIPSPFLGVASWSFVAALLEGAYVVDYGGVAEPDWFDGAARRIAAKVDDQPWIAVLHSSAGAFAPSLAATSANLRGLIFVDAVLPHPGKSAAETAPAAQIDALRKITSDGLLARWDQWFSTGVVEAWIPDQQARTAFLADIPQVPFAFLEARVPIDTRWEHLPARYVRLSDGFERQAIRAEESGWEVARLDSSHLGMVSSAHKLAAVLRPAEQL